VKLLADYLNEQLISRQLLERLIIHPLSPPLSCCFDRKGFLVVGWWFGGWGEGKTEARGECREG